MPLMVGALVPTLMRASGMLRLRHMPMEKPVLNHELGLVDGFSVHGKSSHELLSEIHGAGAKQGP